MLRSISRPKFIIKSEEERFVLGEVYFDRREDTDGEFMYDTEVRKACHYFMTSGGYIDRQHDKVKSSNLFCENFFVEWDNDPRGFAKGSWVLGAYIYNDTDWEKVKKGEWNGWSWSGDASIIPVLCEVDHPLKMEGAVEPFPPTAESYDQHFHDLSIKFDNAGRVVPGITGPAYKIDNGKKIEVDPHVHSVDKTTATAEELNHSHRIVIEE